MPPRRPTRRSFTLTELMVAVIVLLVVIVATSKIFGTASKVTGLGQAGAAVLQEAATIERRIRADFDAISREGFLAIRCVAVRNSVNLAAGGPLLDPELPPGAWIRADQIVVITNGLQSVQGFRAAAGIQRKGQGMTARIYYGHGFQVPQGPPAQPVSNLLTDAIDPVIDREPPGVGYLTNPLVPWYRGPFRNFQEVHFQKYVADTPLDYTTGSTVDPVNVTQPPALQWLLARQAVTLVDDGGSPNVYLTAPGGEGGVRSTAWIGNDVIVNGRVDASAARLGPDRSGLGEIRFRVTDDGSGTMADWYPVQRDAIGSLVFYPRAERHAPSMNRVDQALTNHTLASACSSFTVDWTYADGVGAANASFPGVRIVTPEQPWFGIDPDNSRGVRTFTDYVSDALPGSDPTAPVDPASIERFPPDLPDISKAGEEIRTYGPSDVWVYEAFFGYNQARPLDLNGLPWGANTPSAYTPFPSAIRVTMTLHDPAGKLSTGRVVQMVFDLARRG